MIFLIFSFAIQTRFLVHLSARFDCFLLERTRGPLDVYVNSRTENNSSDFKINFIWNDLFISLSSRFQLLGKELPQRLEENPDLLFVTSFKVKFCPKKMKK